MCVFPKEVIFLRWQKKGIFFKSGMYKEKLNKISISTTFVMIPSNLCDSGIVHMCPDYSGFKNKIDSLPNNLEGMNDEV